MAVASIPLIPKDGTLLVQDGAALTYTIVYEDGDFSITGMMKGQMQVQSFKDRGITYAVRETEDGDIEFSFSCHAISLLGDGSTAMPTDVFLKKGVWASATSLLPTANGDGYLTKLTYTGERTSPGGATADTTAVLKYCHVTMDFSEGIPGKLSIKGRLFPLSTDYITLTG